MPETRRLLTLTETARLLGLAPATLRNQVEHGKGPIPTKINYTHGRPTADRMQYGWSLDEIERWVRTEADADTAITFWLARAWLAMRNLSAREVSVQLAALSDVCAETADFPAVAGVWAAIGMALLADAKGRDIKIIDPEPEPAPALGLVRTP